MTTIAYISVYEAVNDNIDWLLVSGKTKNSCCSDSHQDGTRRRQSSRRWLVICDKNRLHSNVSGSNDDNATAIDRRHQSAPVTRGRGRLITLCWIQHNADNPEQGCRNHAMIQWSTGKSMRRWIEVLKLTITSSSRPWSLWYTNFVDSRNI